MPRWLIHCALLLLFAVHTPLAATTPGGFRIAGVVVDSVSGAPIDRAAVTIGPVTSLDDTVTVLTSSNGQFLFAGLAAGKYRLTAGRRGYTFQGLDQHETYMTAIAVGQGLDSEHIRFRLFPEAVLAGNVSNDFGDPVRDARVLLFQRKIFSGAHTTSLVSRGATDDKGNYRFAHLAAGVYTVAVYAKPWYASSQGAGLRFADGIGIRQVGFPDSNVEHAPPIPESAPNPNLDVVYPVSFYSNAGTLDTATPLSLVPGGSFSADFTLHAVPALRLRVKLPAEASENFTHSPPMDETASDSTTTFAAAIQVSGEELENLSAQPVTGEPGYYEIFDAPPGELKLTASWLKNRGPYTEQSKTAQVSAESRIDMELPGPLASVSGTVQSNSRSNLTPEDDGEGLSPMLYLLPRGTENSVGTKIGEKGSFSLSLPAGQYEVSISGYGDSQIDSIKSPDAIVSGHIINLLPGKPVKLEVQLTIPNCSVAGFAMKEGKPIPGAMILLIPVDSAQNASLFHRDQSDSDGSFTLASVLPGRYALLAIENGWDLEWANLAVLFRYLPNGQPLELKPGSSVKMNPKVQ